MNTTHSGSPLTQLENTLDLYLRQKAPALPANVKEVIVSWSPWITLILLILAVPVLLAAFGLTTFMMPFAMMGGGASLGFDYVLTWIFVGATIVLEGLAIPGLMKRQRSAWNLIFYAELLSIVHNLIRFDIPSAVIGGVIGLYFLFQIREYYK